MKKYVLLEGIKEGNRFFTRLHEGEDPTKGGTGETWYRIIGYADTIKEAQDLLFGGTPALQLAKLIQDKANLLKTLETISVWLIAPDLSQQTLDHIQTTVDNAIKNAKMFWFSP